MSTARAIFTLALRSLPATREQRVILCASCSCCEEGSLLFCISPLSVRKSSWYWFPQTLTHSLLLRATECSSGASPITKFAEFPSGSRATPTRPWCTCPLLSPPCGHPKLPMPRSRKHLYIYSLSLPFLAASAMHLSSAGLDDLYSQSGPVEP